MHGDDDEDIIPEEQLLKYTKADSLEQEDFPVEINEGDKKYVIV